MKSLDRKLPKNAEPLLKVLQRRNGEDRGQKPFSNPLKQKTKHLKGIAQEPYPNPSCFAMERGSGEEKEGKSFQEQIWRGEDPKGAGSRRTDDGGGGSRALGHGRLG